MKQLWQCVLAVPQLSSGSTDKAGEKQVGFVLLVLQAFRIGMLWGKIVCVPVPVTFHSRDASSEKK